MERDLGRHDVRTQGSCRIRQSGGRRSWDWQKRLEALPHWTRPPDIRVDEGTSTGSRSHPVVPWTPEERGDQDRTGIICLEGWKTRMSLSPLELFWQFIALSESGRIALNLDVRGISAG